VCGTRGAGDIGRMVFWGSTWKFLCDMEVFGFFGGVETILGVRSIDGGFWRSLCGVLAVS